jgi:oligoendopeptidase F
LSTDTDVRSHSIASDFAGPSWENTSEYPSITSNEFARDLVLVDQLIHQLSDLATKLRPSVDRQVSGRSGVPDDLIIHLQTHADLDEQARTLLANLITYVECERSIDGQNAEATRVYSILMKRRARLNNAVMPIRLFLTHASEEVISRYLQHPRTECNEFALRQARRLANTRLSENEETMLEQMRPHSIDAWGNLYSQISGTLRCTLEGVDRNIETVGLAEAVGVLRDGSARRRRSAWYGIQAAWKIHEDSCAAILNGLAGWRLEEYQRRSGNQSPEIDFLEIPLHNERISQKTLTAMMTAVEESREIGQRAMRAMARGFGKQQMDPWDLMAPAPNQAQTPEHRSFREGLRLVREAFGAIDSHMADFVGTMEKNRWIEGRILPNKRQGAFCTHFQKSRTPRVFQTYMGSLADVRILAHELGHAYHAWATRDLPRLQRLYPMTLAETASIFAETALADSLLNLTTNGVQYEIAWQNAEAATGFLLNIPARFDFEKLFYERRSTASYVTPHELGELTETAWRKWYGNSLSETERQYWMTKLHFSMSRFSFYNFPYTFGYLYSLGLYARRAEFGPKFFPMYNALLRDTGRMTVEELTLRHFGEDLTRPEFWQKGLKIVNSQVEQFECLLASTTK